MLHALLGLYFPYRVSGLSVIFMRHCSWVVSQYVTFHIGKIPDQKRKPGADDRKVPCKPNVRQSPKPAWGEQMEPHRRARNTPKAKPLRPVPRGNAMLQRQQKKVSCCH